MNRGVFPKNEVSFLRTTVNHYSFAIGLLYGESTSVNVLLNAHIYEGYKVVNPLMFGALKETPYHNVLEGGLFQCCDLLSFIGDTYDSKILKEHTFCDSPSNMVIETWYPQSDDYKWKMQKLTIWNDIKWLDAAHTGDGGDRMCAGIATFTCENKTMVDVDGETVDITRNIKNPPYYELRRILLKNMTDPKHPENYIG